MIVALVMSCLLLTIGRVAYAVDVQTSTLVGLAIPVARGAASFSCLSFAYSTRIGAADAAAPATNPAVLPLYFISGFFVHEPDPRIPARRRQPVPIRHLSQALPSPFVTPRARHRRRPPHDRRRLRTRRPGIAALRLALVAAHGVGTAPEPRQSRDLQRLLHAAFSAARS